MGIQCKTSERYLDSRLCKVKVREPIKHRLMLRPQTSNSPAQLPPPRALHTALPEVRVSFPNLDFSINVGPRIPLVCWGGQEDGGEQQQLKLTCRLATLPFLKTRTSLHLALSWDQILTGRGIWHIGELFSFKVFQKQIECLNTGSGTTDFQQ